MLILLNFNYKTLNFMKLNLNKFKSIMIKQYICLYLQLEEKFFQGLTQPFLMYKLKKQYTSNQLFKL